MKLECMSYLLAGWLLFLPGKYQDKKIKEQTSENEDFKSLVWFNWFKKKTCFVEIQEIGYCLCWHPRNINMLTSGDILVESDKLNEESTNFQEPWMLLIAEVFPARVFCMFPVKKDLAIDPDLLRMSFSFWWLRYI